MASGEVDRQRAFHDPRDLTPFRGVRVSTPVHGILGRFGRAGATPRLRRFPGKVERAVFDAVFRAGEPERLIVLARSHPGWSGLCYVMAGLIAYRSHQHAQAAELLQRGLAGANEHAAAQFAADYLAGWQQWVEVAEGVNVDVVFSEEAVCLALAHSLREIGHPHDALAALSPLPPSLPASLAACRLAEILSRHADVVAWTDGLTNRDDLAATLLILRARALRVLGRRTEAQDAVREVMRRRRTSLALRHTAMTERALLALGMGRRPSLGKDDDGAARPRAKRTKDAEVKELWLRDFERLTGERPE
ncbi:hypothetical protein [Sinomonas sp. ASV322]|uniref:hypothetical protein n=1 Tax=Sinomonas sp. ASV322 TaxID=3041920 RepID=UPI0027DADBB6|nr:hypothetical protein [Sinomonas sp. ASV322]MDQ4503402.1 hypothetical protein [Sinomonas sp. ASV322]